ncbi:DNA repair exonuclease [Companilactobacillus sp. RD055328]|uniref:metallophosphoesterase family protein n=1 Tax=Companilactobacillus sp. RD055328 TaxID=2916634 RepID=UPI001FC81920|nr:DNA repair exonuclease [Companilactobacillus sp. RD055328]GKQ42487.1 DNA repair exonuclease [Companilactobacillus sp. RD055328]
MRFIHAADIHLGHLFQGVKRISQSLQDEFKEATFNAFERIIDTAIAEKVDFVILAGDEYDRHQRSLKEQDFLRMQFLRLQEYGIDVFMVYGNHDYLTEESTFIEFPDNVHVFSKEVTTETILTSDNKRVGISGFSYDQQHIMNDYLAQYPDKQSNEDYHIGILHGMTKTQSQDYAPFEMTDMISKGYEYWALGHIHKREVLNENPAIVYSGNPQGLNRTETGDKGFYLVEVNNGQTNLEFMKSQIFTWDEITISADENDATDDLRRKIIEASDNLVKDTLISVNIHNAQKLNSELQNQIEDTDFLKYLQSYLEEIHIYAYKINVSYNNEAMFEDMDKEFWNQSQQEIFTIENVRNLDKNIVNYDMIRNHIEEPGYLNSIIEKSNNELNHKKKGR